MVERGQVLERMTLVPGPAGALEGLYQGGARVRQEPAPPVILASPHPRLGGSMDAAVLAEIVWQLARRGHPTLRFNWRGVGASEGMTRVPWLPAASQPALDDEAADLEAAIAQHAGGHPSAVVGVSFGAAVAARVAAVHPAVERVVLVAPPVAHLRFDVDALVSSGVVASVIVGAQDTVAPPALVQSLFAPRVSVSVIAGAGHGFAAGLTEVGRRVALALPGADEG